VNVVAPAVSVEGETVVAERVDRPVVEEDQRLEEQTPVANKIQNARFVLSQVRLGLFQSLWRN